MSEDEGVERHDLARRAAVMKSFVIGMDDTIVETSRAQDETPKLFESAGGLVPPYNPRVLNDLFENASTLRSNVDAYATNIDANGFHLEPSIALEGDDARTIVADAIHLERLEARDRGQIVPNLIPTEDEITARIADVRRRMAIERYRTTAFFDACTIEESLTSLRRRTRQDLEVTGNAYWEILRDSNGKVAQFSYLPVATMRLTRQGTDFVDIVVPRRFSPITVVREKRKRRFRKFVQVIEGTTSVVYFKELGDPRVMSSKTGKYYSTDLAMRNEEGEGVRVATEVYHFRIASSGSPYGVPRWIGSLLSVMGTRHAEEVNFLYFENKSVPPMALLVSGGRVSSDSVDRIRSFIDVEIKGKKNFHKVLIIEAESPGESDNNGKVKIELRPLTQAQQQDALFQKYDERNADKVGIMFRLPRMLRGDVRDFNRSTADAALEFAEMQVFGPERAEFDFTMNRFVLADLDVRFWSFVSNGVQVRDPKAMAEIIAKLTGANVLVAADARALVGEMVFGRKLPEIDADWIYQPAMLTQVGVPFDTAGRDNFIPRTDDVVPPNGPDVTANDVFAAARGKIAKMVTRSYGGKTVGEVNVAKMAADILALRDALADVEAQAARAKFEKAAKLEASETEERAPVAKSSEPEVVHLKVDDVIGKFAIIPHEKK